MEGTEISRLGIAGAKWMSFDLVYFILLARFLRGLSFFPPCSVC